MFLSPPLCGGSGEAAGIVIERYLSRTYGAALVSKS
jgi:hypothetical protein